MVPRRAYEQRTALTRSSVTMSRSTWKENRYFPDVVFQLQACIFQQGAASYLSRLNFGSDRTEGLYP
ncbi:U-box domain-containing protein 43-like [Pyrus ussuriensis x Pyrus communis]|uniref:U-box domain-containing protein 43-like n=1 Tax=Pyrus ussuriensis x Pyrus communis TaxID=2448454 RepID=A0A5N5F1K1_9ROSA|nr:U-box domain-containing protein 43-like [Pyrus ussuriensis x Pyrus communis]